MGFIRRGVAPAAEASVWCSEAGASAVPLSWTQATVRAALQFAAGGTSAAAVSGPVSAIAKGAIETMMFAKLKLAAAIGMLLFVTLGLGAIAALYRSGAAATPGERFDASFKSGVTSEAESPDDRYRATFKNGAMVEVIGVSAVPTGPHTWWKFDGSPLSEAPVDSIKSRFSATEGGGSPFDPAPRFRVAD